MRRLAALALASLVAASSALAWTPQTRIKMVDEAIRLMPGSLSLALAEHRDDVRRGALGPMANEDSPAHQPPWGGGTLDAEIAARAGVLVAEVETMTSFAAVAQSFGELAHFVSDAGFPPGASGGDGDGRYTHFAEFCETRGERFPLVFYGHEDRELAAGSFEGFALSILARAKDEDGELARAYAAAGDPPNPAYFDDRSVPFAVGSLSYSHTVTNIVRAWLAAWEQAGGDTGLTPYRDPSATDSKNSGSDRRP